MSFQNLLRSFLSVVDAAETLGRLGAGRVSEQQALLPNPVDLPKPSPTQPTGGKSAVGVAEAVELTKPPAPTAPSDQRPPESEQGPSAAYERTIEAPQQPPPRQPLSAPPGHSPAGLSADEHERRRAQHQEQIEVEQSLRRELLEQLGLLKKVPKKDRTTLPRWYPRQFKATAEQHPAGPHYLESLAREAGHRRAVEFHSNALAQQVGLRMPAAQEEKPLGADISQEMPARTPLPPAPSSLPLPPEYTRDKTGGHVMEGVGTGNARDYTRELRGEPGPQPAGAGAGLPPPPQRPTAAPGGEPGPRPSGAQAGMQLPPSPHVAPPAPDQPVTATPAPPPAPDQPVTATPAPQPAQAQERVVTILGRIFALLSRFLFAPRATRPRTVAEETHGLSWGARERRLQDAGTLLSDEETKDRLALVRKPTRQQRIRASEEAEQESRDKTADSAPSLQQQLGSEFSRLVGRLTGRGAPAATAGAAGKAAGAAAQAAGRAVGAGAEAAGGMAGAAGSAAGGVIGLIAVHALIELGKAAYGLAKAMVELPDIISDWASGLVQSKRELAQFNAGIAITFARLEYAERIAKFRTAQQTSGSTQALGDAVASLKEEIQPFQSLMATLVNLLKFGVVEQLRLITLIIKLNPTNKAVEQIVRQLDKLLDRNKGKDLPYVDFLRSLAGVAAAEPPRPKNLAGDAASNGPADPAVQGVKSLGATTLHSFVRGRRR